MVQVCILDEDAVVQPDLREKVLIFLTTRLLESNTSHTSGCDDSQSSSGTYRA